MESVEHYISLVKENRENLKDIPEEVQIAHPEICMEAVKKDADAIRYVPEEVKISNPEICLEAVKQYTNTIRYVPEEAKIALPEIYLEVVKQSNGYGIKNVFKDIPEKVKIAHPEIYLEAVKKNVELFNSVPEEVKISNPEICMEAVRNDEKVLQYVPEAVQMDHPEICLGAIKKSYSFQIENVFKNIPEKVKIAHPEIYLDAVKKNVELFNSVPEEVKVAHSEICLEAVKQYAGAFEYVPEEAKIALPEICLEAVKQSYGYDIKYVFQNVPEKVKVVHPEICMEAVKKNGEILQYVPKAVQIDHPEICMEAVKEYGSSLSYVPEEVKISNSEICMEAVKQYQDALEYVPEELKISNPEICLGAVRKDGRILQYVPKAVQIDHPEICIEAVKISNGYDIKYVFQNVPEEVKVAHPEICIEALKKDREMLQYLPKAVQIDHPEICMEAVKISASYLQYVSDVVQEAHPEICMEAVKKDADAIKYVPEDLQIDHPEICLEAVKKYKRAIQYVPDVVQEAHPDMCMEAIALDFVLAKYISVGVYSNEDFRKQLRDKYLQYMDVNKEMLDNYIIPNMNNGAFLKYVTVLAANNFQDHIWYDEYNYDPANYDEEGNYYYPQLELYDDDIRDVLKPADIFIRKIGSLPYNLGLMYNFNVERVDEYTNEKWNNLKQNNCFKASQDYREYLEDRIIATIWGLLGYDEASRLLSKVPNLTDDELSKLIQTDEQSFKQVFEEVYLVQGNLEYSSEIVRKLNVLGLNKKDGKNKVFEIYKSLNRYLESDSNLDLESLKSFLDTEAQNSGLIVSDKDKVLVSDMLTGINNKLSNDKLSKIEGELKNRIGQNFENIGVTLQDIIQGQIKRQLNGTGKINQSELLSELEKEIMSTTGDNEYRYSPQIREKMNEILEFTKGYTSEQRVLDTLNLSVGHVLKEQKEKIGQGWIRKLQQVSPKLDREQLEAIETSLGFKIDTQKQIQIQEPSDERLKELELTREKYIKKAYKLLSSTSNKELLIYNKAELMFDGIYQPYSQDFAKYFIKHKQEIMENPEYYQNLSRIHNNFESIISSPNTRKIYEAGKLELDDVLRILSEIKYENVKTGEYKLAEVAAESGLSEFEFTKAREIFNITSNRQYQTIPPMNESKGKFRGRLLRADDPLHIVVGNITLCCQKVGGAGESSMLHSAMEKNGGIFVIERLDDEGNVTEIVTQSWTWRNKDRLCFDNIEVRQEGSLSEEEQGQILDIYKKAGEEAITTDKKMLSKMLKDGKITQEMYDSLLLKQVTAGLGYNDLEILSDGYNSGEIEKANIVLPKETDIYTDAAANQALLAQIDQEELRRIEQRRKEVSVKKDYDLEDIPLGYGKTREIIDLIGHQINRDVVSDISNIEKIAFRGKQQVMGRCETIDDIAERYGMDLDSIQISMSKDKDWYVIYTENQDEIYVADMAMLNGVNSEKNEEVKTDLRSSGYELLEKTYMLLLKAAEDSKTLRFEATEDTSYINIQKAVEKGLAEVVENYETTFDEAGEIKMHNMVIKPNLEAVKKELEEIRRIKKKIDEKRILKGYEKGDAGSR